MRSQPEPDRSSNADSSEKTCATGLDHGQHDTAEGWSIVIRSSKVRERELVERGTNRHRLPAVGQQRDEDEDARIGKVTR
jgi:hypothetical protein